MNQYVKYNVNGQLATIEFYHPAHNSLPSNLLKEMELRIHDAVEDSEVQLILIKSGGERSFCAGASFDELKAITDVPSGQKFFRGFASLINAMRKCPKLIVGRIQGKAVGGAVGLAAATDYCMATKYASVRLSELALGIGPFVIGPAVQRKIGLSAFSKLALNPNEWQTANWAKECGLFQEVFESTIQLDQYIEHYTQRLTKMSPLAMQRLKKVLWKGTDDWDELLEERAKISGQLLLTEASQKAIQSV